MSNIDKRALREAAEKATPGRIGDRVDGSIKYTCRGTDGTLVLSTDNHDDYGFVGDNSLEDELFFRLCDPVTVMALLNEIAALEQRHCGTALLEREEMHTKTLGRMLDELEAKDKRIAELERKEQHSDRQSVIDALASSGEEWSDIEEYMQKWDAERAAAAGKGE